MPPSGAGLLDIICLSHLAWEQTLFQRPQQLMRQMEARGHRVLYCGCIGLQPLRNLQERRGSRRGRFGNGGAFINHFYSPYTRRMVWMARTAAVAAVAQAAREVLYTPVRPTFRSRPERRPTGPLLWLYHPGLLPLALMLRPSRIVYDVMDRFASFALRDFSHTHWERDLLAMASTVFTGGRSLHAACEAEIALLRAANRWHNKPFVCLPSGVDAAHFARALKPLLRVPPDIAALPKPVFGYHGAIDERVDFDLLRALCLGMPQASVVLIGPVLGRPDDLPPNLHLIGPRPYEDLPACIKGFDVCLIPFRRTDLVAHVSPTKTPEYLAAGKPVVSTPIPDVEYDYGDLVTIASQPDEFLAACQAAASRPPDPQWLSAQAAQRARSWAAIAALMEAAITGQSPLPEPA
ncbi:MAG: glycosyltransferase [Candidatus Sumerlaeaceae bacterium]|nr:glycosyltransferase [Candidatus Sumerlaeaceae bacterium]